MPVKEKSLTSKTSSSDSVSKSQMEGEQPEDFSTLVSEVTASVKKYSSHQPRVVTWTIFAVGFILGWKLRPW